VGHHCFRARRGYIRAKFDGARIPLEEQIIFISPAFAQAAGASQGGIAEMIMQVAPFGLILVIMYFLIMRPQQKRAREHADLIKNIRRGDSIVTTGGLIGKVTKVVDDGELEVEIAPNVRVRVARPMVSDVRAKGEPVKDQA
jgi:preprotein translocase subunit YajC